MSARSLCYSISRETVRDYWGGVWGVPSHRTTARGHSPEQNSINEFLVHKREIVPQHKFCVHVIHAPKVRFDSNETARLATTTRALPIPEYGPSVSNQTLLMFRKTVHTGTTIVEVVATYERTGAGPVSVRSLCFSFLCEKVCEYFGRVFGVAGLRFSLHADRV